MQLFLISSFNAAFSLKSAPISVRPIFCQESSGFFVTNKHLPFLDKTIIIFVVLLNS